jgi:hypothetical protein
MAISIKNLSKMTNQRTGKEAGIYSGPVEPEDQSLYNTVRELKHISHNILKNAEALSEILERIVHEMGCDHNHTID